MFDHMAKLKISLEEGRNSIFAMWSLYWENSFETLSPKKQLWLINQWTNYFLSSIYSGGMLDWKAYGGKIQKVTSENVFFLYRIHTYQN